jgi:alkylated DNA repair dioxygenase AlkB
MRAAHVALPDAELAFDPHWLPQDEADAVLQSLTREIAWEQHRIRLFGRELDVPRLSCWVGDPGADYVYSRTRFEPRPWSATLSLLRERIEASTQASFNSVLANLYRDGQDSMGWHSDDEPELGLQPTIASLSLGASRRFVFRRRVSGGEQRTLVLTHGSLLIMRGDTQQHWHHALPRTRRSLGMRINLTFRRILAPRSKQHQGHAPQGQ